MTSNAFGPAYNVLDKLMKRVTEVFFANRDVGNVALIIHRKRGAYGYCNVKENWTIREVPTREIAITPECLTQGAECIIVTMAHELVHAYNAMQGTKDCSGKKHNKSFKKVCDEIGLHCIESEKTGFTTPFENLPEDMCSKIALVLSGLNEEELTILNNLKNILDDKQDKKKDRNLLVYQCPQCGQKIRAKKQINIICGDCMQQFVAHIEEGE